MGRKPTVWFRKQTGWWMTTVRGKKIKLARDKKEAEKAFHLLLATDEAPEESAHRRPSFRIVADRFLEHSKGTNEEGTYLSHKRYLQSFCDHIGNKKAPDLKGHHVTTWLKAHPTWGQSTRSLAIQAVKAALNHAVQEGYLSLHPLIKVKQGTIRRRERILTEEERKAIRARATGSFKDFLFALEHTGARPFSEIARLEARFINWEEGTAELPKHKTMKHGKRRILYFTPEMMELLRRLAEKYPDGLLFRNRYGNPWDRFAFNKWGEIFRKELGIEGVTAYSVRHSYCSDAIARGVPLPVLAELVGTSVKMLLLHYSHMTQKRDVLKAAASRAVGG